MYSFESAFDFSDFALDYLYVKFFNKLQLEKLDYIFVMSCWKESNPCDTIYNKVHWMDRTYEGATLFNAMDDGPLSVWSY